MKKMTSIERILTTLKLQEPDRVPTFDGVHKKVRDAITGNPNASYEDFVDFVDTDGIVVGDRVDCWSYEDIGVSKTGRQLKRGQWGAIVQYTAEETGVVMEAGVKSEEELDTYVPPDPDEEWRYNWLKQLVKRFKGQRAIIAGCTDIFDVAKENILGDKQYYRSMVKNPELIDRANEIALNYQLKYLKNSIDLGADIAFVNGDWAMTQGPMVSRKFTERFLVPPFRKIVEYCHSRGIPVIKHTDGNIWPIYDLIIDAGTDGLHPIDPMAGMDMADAKAKFGDKICLCGNVSCAFSLVSGTVEDVVQETKEVIRKAGKGGGLICMSSNSVHSGVKPENYVAMIKTIKEYGKYPLELN
jgi:uroporphyrinogen decarboxylase